MLNRIGKLVDANVARLRQNGLTSKKFGLFVAALSAPVLIGAWFARPLCLTGIALSQFVALTSVVILLSLFPVYVSTARVDYRPILPITMAMTLLLGPFFALLAVMIGVPIGLFCGPNNGSISKRKLRWYAWAFIHNVPMAIVATGVPTVAFQLLLDLHAFHSHSFLAGVALSGACVADFYINCIFVTTLACLWSAERWDVIWHNNFRWTLPNTLLLAPIGYIMGILVEQNLFVGLGFILLPVLAINRGYGLHETQIRIYRSGVEMLGKLMQESHPYTHGHLNRVATWAMKIAQAMELPPESIEHVENAAILHDIGKISIDDRILNKVEKLTDEEWVKIKEHPVVGADIAAKMKYLDHVSVWIRHHHERMDGKGYPDGLIGEHIPIESKIICVVDAFDAMVGGPSKADQRPYRKPKTLEEAREELVRCAGTQFDTDVVTAFLAVLDEDASEEQAIREACLPITPRLTLVAASPLASIIDAGPAHETISLRGAA